MTSLSEMLVEGKRDLDQPLCEVVVDDDDMD